jgi:DNA topoisomerase IA
MKNIIISVFILLAGVGIANAQKAPEKTTAKTTKVSQKKVDKMVKTTEKSEGEITNAAKKKENKMAKAPLNTTGVKKNGTPDMRYKANKKAKTDTVGPLKKNGTPDLRYKSNKKK